MRLHRLKIRNIASLKGEHLVDFSDIQKVSSLFAITGETGAGKSSILNCIGLALYGQIFKKTLIQTDVVTLGEKEGQIELIFEVKGKNYLAFWKARVRKLNGELYSTPQSPTRELYVLEGSDFNSPKTITTQRIDELMNLDFDQFCKCVILNQGEFAKFLTSSFTDRKDILEKLYPGELLESMSRELKSQMDELSRSRNDLDVKLQESAGEEHHGEDLRAGLEQATKELGMEEGRLNQIEEVSKHFSSLATYHEKYLEASKKIALLTSEISTQTSARNAQLTEAESLKSLYQTTQKTEESLSPRLLELIQLEESAQNTKTTVENLKKKIVTIEADLEKLRLKETQASQQIGTQTQLLGSITKDLKYPLEELLRSGTTLERLFDEMSALQLKESTLENHKTNLSQAEVQGKELAQTHGELRAKMANFPADLELKIADLERKRLELKSQSEKYERQKFQQSELLKSLSALESEIKSLDEKNATNTELARGIEQKLLPLEHTLSLSELLSAKEICLAAAHDSCPVCETQLSPARLEVLREGMGKTDLDQVKAQAEKWRKELVNLEAELKQSSRLSNEMKLKQTALLEEKKLLDTNPLTPPLDASLLDADLVNLQKQLWDKAKLQDEVAKLDLDLKKAREQFQKLKLNHQHAEDETKTLSAKVRASQEELKALLPSCLDLSTPSLLRQQLQLARSVREAQAQLEKLEQELSFHRTKAFDLSETLRSSKEEEQGHNRKLTELVNTLTSELAGLKASDKLRELSEKTKLSQEKWQQAELTLKKHDFSLKDLQGRLTQLEELKKDFDLHFSQEQKLCSEKVTLPELALFKSLQLTLQSETELFVPLREKLSALRETSKQKVGDLRGQLGSLKARLEDYEKRQDKIKLLMLQRSEIQGKLDRLDRLFDVLGKDELRTFVLSLVEENLIIETNQELQRLCQGRYEIVHQSRRLKNPDFYILDKYREGGLRKVSTLSGGETFMVSLAMALALAEMTRGQAEIDSLFIDEGFGTLDQDSLEDVLEMLNQIQTRGLMVGIISHIKPLTNSLPVNLILNKKQDGTSTVKLQYN